MPDALLPFARDDAPRDSATEPTDPRALASVCLPIPVDTEFTYRVPQPLRAGLEAGRRVLVPFGKRTMPGWCVGFAEPPDAPASPDEEAPELKAVEELLDDGPLVDGDLLTLARWMAETYACSWGEAISACVPASVRTDVADATLLHARIAVAPEEAEAAVARFAEKQPKRARVLRILLEHPDGLAVKDLVRAAQCSDSPVKTLAKHDLVTIEHRVVELDPFGRVEPEPPAEVRLTPEQEEALGGILDSVAARRHEVVLLHGVTGSGKTEVYLRAIRATVDAGRQALVLVPEIALTPQTVARFRGWFDRVAVLHSALTDAERRRQWRRIHRGEADVVIGPRSAVFAPVADLGLIVVDEEHETSFKQQSAPRYRARDVAVERSRMAGAVVVLGSATPSLESWQDAAAERFRLCSLPRRVGGGKLPRIEVVDMVTEARETGARLLLSRRLVELLRRAVGRREQGILFLNRRGYATSVFCSRCGTTLSCSRCSVSLTFHRRHGTVLCHPCGEEKPVPRTCPGCGAPGMARLGAGTERLEDALRSAVPGVRFARMDSDVMHDRASYEDVLSRFGRGSLDVLVGTQMIAKGLHFPKVTVVGVVSADSSLLVPDFRAAERTFQLVSQVAGRAGRGERPGHVVVQTVQPHHPALRAAAEHDFVGFAGRELAERRKFGWPPFTRLVRVVVSGRDEAAVEKRARKVADAVRVAIPPRAGQVLGPAPCPVVRIKNRFRWHLVVKAADEPVQRAVVMRLGRFSRRASGTELMVDVDPADLV